MSHGQSSLRCTLLVIITLLLPLVVPTSRCFAAPPAASEAKSDQIVVMISVDGLAAFYMDDPHATMPNIRALAEQGVWSRMKASAPTVTWPNHTNLVTGTTSAAHGVVGNEYFDRAQNKPVQLIWDLEFNKDQIVRVPTIYDVAHNAGLRTASVRWPASRGAKTLDWTVPDVGSDKLLRDYTTPELMLECREAGLWGDAELVRPNQKGLYIIEDEPILRVFKHLLVKHRPNLALFHLLNVDSVEHKFGPQTPEAYTAVANADRQVGEIWDVLKREFPGKATLLVVSDHGFSKINHTIFPNVVMRNLGLATVAEGKVTGGSVRIVVQGGSAFVYVLDAPARTAILAKIRQFFTGSPGIREVAGPGQLKEHGVAEPTEDPNAPDMILFAEDGFAFSDKADGNATVNDEPQKRGTHGHDENMPILHATFVAWGNGIKPGVRPALVNNTDVAPTIARLLGLKMPQATGKVIEEALAE